MKLDGLSLEQAPPISVPFRFFITAPIFGMIGALLLMTMGDAALASRWTPGMLAITHAWLLGFFAMVMFGALLQMLPVLAGAVIGSPRMLANLVLPLWSAGVIALQVAFLKGTPPLFMLAISLLAAAVVIFVLFCGAALYRATSQIDSVLGMKLALLSLVITLLLGIILGMGHSGWLALLRPIGTNVHAMWGLLGWIGLLVVSVSWQVVPMFQITASYPRALVRLLAPVLFVLFLLRMVAVLLPSIFSELNQTPPLIMLLLDLGISALLILFAVNTLWLQYCRKRKIRDTHTHYWRIGCISLILVVSCWWLGQGFNEPSIAEQLKLWSVVLFITGFVMSIMTGMLYKIVSFLVWFHLQAVNTQRMMAGKSLIQVPHMKAVISEKRTRLQLWVFLAALLAVPFALTWPVLDMLAGGLWLLHFGVMTVNLGSAANHYRRAMLGS